MKTSFLIIYFSLTICFITGQEDLHFINFNKRCLRCLCVAATGCNLTLACGGGYCGPFAISKVYWLDAKSLTIPGDDPTRQGAYEDCATTFSCAQKVIANYILKYGKDCNQDGVTNCDDYALLNFNGGPICYPPLNTTEKGRQFLVRYTACNPLDFLDVEVY